MLNRRPRASSPELAGRNRGKTVTGALHALVLRSPVLLVAPLVPLLMSEFQATATQISLLTALPVVCFGLLAPTGRWALGARGLSWVLVASAGLIALGSTIRSTAGFATALAGTVVFGLGIAWGNVAFPLAVNRDYPRHTSQAAAVGASLFNVSASAVTAAGPWLAAAVGWRATLALPAPLAVAAAFGWARLRRRERESAPSSLNRDKAPAAKGTLLLTIAFTGHTISYYACSAWLPTYFHDVAGFNSATAAAAATLFQLTSIAGPLIAGFLGSGAGRRLRAVALGTGAGWLALPVGLLFLPVAWPGWVVLAGLAQGAAYTVVMALAIRNAAGNDDLATASSRIQGVAYTAAALGPVLVGTLLDLGGGWGPAFWAVAALLGVMTVCLWLVSGTPRARLGQRSSSADSRNGSPAAR